MKKTILTLLIAMWVIIPLGYSFSLEVIETDPAPIVAGDYADVTFRFTTTPTDGDLDNVRVNVLETDMIKPLQGHEIFISKIFSGESLTRTIRIYFSDELEQGFIDVPFTANFNDRTLLKPKVRVFVQDANSNPDLQIGDIETIPNELLADTRNNKMTVKVQNLGDRDAELVKAELVVAEIDKIKPSYSFSFIDSEASIGSGEEGSFVFDLDILELVQGEVPATLKLRYRTDEGTDSTYKTLEKELEFNIPIADSPYLFVEDVELLDNFEIGSSENRVRITLKNGGTEDAEEVRVRMIPDVSYPFAYEQTTEYVTSKIKPGQSAQVEFKIEVLSNAQLRDYPTTVLLESLVSETRYSREDVVTVKATGKEPRSNTQVATYVIVIVFIVSSGLGYFAYRSKKKSKK